MKCSECGSTMSKTVGDHLYREAGMDHVTLRDVAHYGCSACGQQHVEIECMAQLHRLLAETIAIKPERLVPPEIRFVRDYLGLSNQKFAALMGVTESQASRWASSNPRTSEQMQLGTEHFLRVLAALGPTVFAGVVGVAAIDVGEIVRVASTLKQLPPRGARTQAMPVAFKHARASGWQVLPRLQDF